MMGNALLQTARMRRALVLAVLVAVAAAAPAAAQDDQAPKGALPHWLPSEQWVYQHWLPYDEGRLYALLGSSRGAVWRHLRDDAAHDLAQLARRRGMQPSTLARRLVAPRARQTSAARARRLRSRALRTLTQGHLAQHILFHSLHQSAVPRRARFIFGTAGTEDYLRLRRAELSPLQIGRLHGRSDARVRARVIATLRAEGRRGVRNGSFSARQAAILLDRQLRQVPRWLGQTRYNGPPRTSADFRPLLPPGDFANNPTISGDGTRVVWDAYRAKIPEARRLGEISVLAADLRTLRTTPVSHPGAPGRRLPRSAYNVALSADGTTVAYETAEGNLNFAKRYGEMQVVARELAGAAAGAVSHPGGSARLPSRTAYNPSVSADGRLVAFEATDAGRGAARSRNALWVFDRRTGRARPVGGGSGGGAYEPRITGDGHSLLLTAGDAASDGHSLVYLRSLATGATTLVSRAGGRGGAAADGDAHEPAASADGRIVAFTSVAGNLGPRGRGSRVYVRDLARGTTTVVGRGVGGFAFDPTVSADGRFVAFAARRGGRSGRRALVWRHDRLTGATVLVSRRRGAAGRAADGYSAEPSVSADGTMVAFTSTASNLAATKPGGLAGVFVRDLVAGTTRLLSTHAPLKARAAGAMRSVGGGASASGAFLCPLAP